MTYKDRHFDSNSFSGRVTGELFENCTFSGTLPNFKACEFHDCQFVNAKVRELISCKLFSTNLVECDFSLSDVSFSITTSGSPCQVTNCKWIGMRAVLDCGFFSGLSFDNQSDPFLFQLLATVPKSNHKKEILKSLPESFRSRIRAILSKPFRLG